MEKIKTPQKISLNLSNPFNPDLRFFVDCNQNSWRSVLNNFLSDRSPLNFLRDRHTRFRAPNSGKHRRFWYLNENVVQCISCFFNFNKFPENLHFSERLNREEIGVKEIVENGLRIVRSSCGGYIAVLWNPTQGVSLQEKNGLLWLHCFDVEVE